MFVSQLKPHYAAQWFHPGSKLDWRRSVHQPARCHSDRFCLFCIFRQQFYRLQLKTHAKPWWCHSPLLFHCGRSWFPVHCWVRGSSAQCGSIQRVWEYLCQRHHLVEGSRNYSTINWRDKYRCVHNVYSGAQNLTCHFANVYNPTPSSVFFEEIYICDSIMIIANEKIKMIPN